MRSMTAACALGGLLFLVSGCTQVEPTAKDDNGTTSASHEVMKPVVPDEETVAKQPTVSEADGDATDAEKD